jgi:hypothetical protein
MHKNIKIIHGCFTYSGLAAESPMGFAALRCRNPEPEKCALFVHYFGEVNLPFIRAIPLAG